MKLKLLIFISVLLSATYISASETYNTSNQLNVNFQLRPRAEYRNGYKYPLTESEKSAGFINQRARLSMDYVRDGLSAGLSIQNISVWGDSPLANNKSNTVINEAWAQLKNEKGLYAKFGRQKLNYDDGRLLSDADWNQTGRYHDALKFGYQTAVNQLDFALVYNQDGEKNSGGSYYIGNGVTYKTLQTFYYQSSGLTNFIPSFIFINAGSEEGNSSTGESKLANMQTFGTNLVYKPTDDVHLYGIAYYQTGRRATINENISAYFLSFKTEFDIIKQFQIIGGTDYLSGEDYNSLNPNGTYNAFNILYGGCHGFYGTIDYFYSSSYRDNMNLGLWDDYLGFSYKWASKYSLNTTYHNFFIASDVYNTANEKLKKGLGSEIDLHFNYSIMKDVKLSCGYSTFFGTQTLDYVKGGDYKV